jgi:hypothetical protein
MLTHTPVLGIPACVYVCLCMMYVWHKQDMVVPPEDSRYTFFSTSLELLFNARPEPGRNFLDIMLSVPWITTVTPFNACSGKLKYPDSSTKGHNFKVT